MVSINVLIVIKWWLFVKKSASESLYVGRRTGIFHSVTKVVQTRFDGSFFFGAEIDCVWGTVISLVGSTNGRIGHFFSVDRCTWLISRKTVVTFLCGSAQSCFVSPPISTPESNQILSQHCANFLFRTDSHEYLFVNRTDGD